LLFACPRAQTRVFRSAAEKTQRRPFDNHNNNNNNNNVAAAHKLSPRLKSNAYSQTRVLRETNLVNFKRRREARESVTLAAQTFPRHSTRWRRPPRSRKSRNAARAPAPSHNPRCPTISIAPTITCSACWAPTSSHRHARLCRREPQTQRKGRAKELGRERQRAKAHRRCPRSFVSKTRHTHTNNLG
jgi:hypothetical protein